MRAAVVKGVLFGLMLTACVYFTRADAAEIEPMIVYDHTSDITRGAPFNNQDEPSAEYIGVGATITAGKHSRWEIDLSHGRKMIDRTRWESGSKLSVRFYPRRGR